MGQEILYCYKCQTRLLGSDFERGKAFRVDSQAACPDCVRDLLAHLPDPDAELEKLKKSQVPKPSGTTSSSTRMPMVRMDSTARMLAPVPRGASEPAAGPKPNRTPLILAAAAGGVVLLVLLAMMFSGSTERRRQTASTPEPAPPEPAPRPVPRPTPVTDPIARDLEELDARTSLLLRQEKIPEVAGILRTARGKSAAPEWTRGIDERLQKLDAAARRLAAPLLEQVGPAAKKGDQAALKALRSRLEAFGIPALITDFDAATASAASDPWIVLDLQPVSTEGGATLAKQPDGSILVGGANPPKDTYTVAATPGLRRVRAFRLEALSNPGLPGNGPGRAFNGNFVLTEFKAQAGGTALAFSGASATFEQDRYPASGAIDGLPLSGWAVSGRLGQTSEAVFHLRTPADLDSITFVLENQSWHTLHVLGCFRISASITELPDPPGPRFAEQYVPQTPVTTTAPPAVLAYRTKWAAAARLAAARDFAAAAKSLEETRAGLTDDALKKEADADLADFKLAADALAEIPRLLPRWTKGAKVAFEFVGENGSTERCEATVLAADARGVSVQIEGGVLDVPAGELAAGSIASLMALRGEKRPTDARAALVLGALEGLTGPGLPERFAEIRAALDPKEAAARRSFWSAEEDFSASRTRGAAGAAYEKILQEPTAFSARNKAFIDERIASTRESFLFADDLAGAGTFTLLSSKTLESYWMSSADAPGKAAANYLETEVLVPAGATLRAWVYAGGCCQEVFTFFLQGAGLSGPSAKNPRETVTATPGGEEWIAVRPPPLGLKKKHSDHTGPKEPDRWAWVELGPLKFAEPGARKLRLLTEQKGLGIAYLAIGSSRQAPPRDAEVKDLVRNRAAALLGPTGTILREIWRGIGGDSVAELVNNPKFKEGKPDESGTITYIDSWNMGEQYGCRIRGYVHPPVTGDYVFWVTSDDHSELWLSADETPAKKQKLCSLNHAVGQRAFDVDPSQKSSPVPLVAGKRYFIEVLHKQGNGPEHVAAGWQLPGGAQERPIPPSRLSAFGAPPLRKIPRPVFRGLAPDATPVKSAYVGGGGGADFENAPAPRQFLRGIRCGLVPSGCVACLKPVYLGPNGDVDGPQTGGGGATQAVIARPGYAVGGMVARGTDRLNAFKLIFMRVSGTRLVASDRYESEWVGTRAGGEETRLGDDGTPVIGIFGRAGGEIDGAGLLLQGK